MTAATSSQRARDTVANYRARFAPEEVTHFARHVVARASPQTPARAKALLFAAAKLGTFGDAHGLELTLEMLRPSMIERFVLSDCTLSPATKRTLRTNLRALSRAVTVGPPGPIALPRDRAKVPYSAGELAAYFALARVQPSELRRRRAEGLLCLGAGAGLVGAELRSVRGRDVLTRSGGLVVVVKGRHARVVPVLAHYHETLLASAHFAQRRYVVGGRDPSRQNVTGPLIANLTKHTDLARLSGARLRSTWLVECATLIGLRTFMDAAGVTCSQRLSDLLECVEPSDERASVELLGR